MKTIIFLLSLILLFTLAAATAQEVSKVVAVHTYGPSANAQQDITNAVDKAGKEGKHVFLQIGGN